MSARAYWDAEREAIANLKARGKIDPRLLSDKTDYEAWKVYDELLATERLACLRKSHISDSPKQTIPLSKPAQRWDGYQ